MSIRLARTHWKRVYGTLTGYLAIAAIILGPMAAYAFFVDFSVFFPGIINPVVGAILVYTALGALLLVFIGGPAHLISVTRIYMVLTGKMSDEVPQTAEPDISLVGG
jgi:hypothetical protein